MAGTKLMHIASFLDVPYMFSWPESVDSAFQQLRSNRIRATVNLQAEMEST